MTTRSSSGSEPGARIDAEAPSVVVLLGAGASKDAGLPLVTELTQPLYQSIIAASGRRGPDVREFIQLAQTSHPDVAWNYETLFKTVLDEYSLPHYGVQTAIGSHPHLRDVPHFFPGQAAICMAEVLGRWPRGNALYLRHLAALARSGPITVFTTNYDLLVETAGAAAGIPVVTGFDEDGTWSPGLFERPSGGVLLHKLHGSVSWFGRPRSAPTEVTEDRSVWNDLEPIVTRKPSLVLGPVKPLEEIKDRWDEIRNFLSGRFSAGVAHASVCVVIGFGWADDYLVEHLVRAHDRGMDVVEVGPTDTGHSILGHGARYVHVPFGAQAALEDGLVSDAIRRLGEVKRTR